MSHSPAGQVKERVEDAAREAAPWTERLARLGYAAKGVVYIVVGILAARAAFGSGGSVDGSEGAIAAIVRQPFGRFLVGAIAIGLFGYALWRFVQAGLDPEGKGSDAKGIARRIGYAISGVIHVGLGTEAARSALRGGGSGGGGESADHWTAMLMRQPFGAWLAAGVGLAIAAYGAYELYKAYTEQLGKRLDLGRMGETARVWAVRASRFGLAARGVVFGIIGGLLVRAALQHDPADAVGLGGALRTLQQQSYGPWLLGAVALGLVGYGIYELVKSRYRRVTAA
jgi:hypothetical protein